MDASRFDTISRLFAQRRLSRRAALASGASLGAAALATVTTAQDATPTGEMATPGTTGTLGTMGTPDAMGTPGASGTVTKTEFLFVQSFQSGTIMPKEGTDGRYTVTLEAGLGQTIYFSDRPERRVGVTPTADFLDGLGFPEDNPPNAALVVETAPGQTDIAVVELFAPVYDAATHTATYEVEVLANWEAGTGLGLSQAPSDLAAVAPAFGTAHLFIDDCADGWVGCIKWNSYRRWYEDVGAYGVVQGEHLPMCYNAGFCIPCEPYGHDQPDRCATYRYWTDKCNNEGYSVDCDGECYAHIDYSLWGTAC